MSGASEGDYRYAYDQSSFISEPDVTQASADNVVIEQEIYDLSFRKLMLKVSPLLERIAASAGSDHVDFFIRYSTIRTRQLTSGRYVHVVKKQGAASHPNYVFRVEGITAHYKKGNEHKRTQYFFSTSQEGEFRLGGEIQSLDTVRKSYSLTRDGWRPLPPKEDKRKKRGPKSK